MADLTEAKAFTSQSTLLPSKVDPTSPRFEANMRFMADLVSQVRNEEEKIREGGGPKAIESQHAKGRLTARERINLLADPGTFFELGIYAAFGMYEDWGSAPSAGVVTGLARIHTRLVMIIANDATVKAGAFFPTTTKKVIRAQNIAIENRIPTIYLVDSAGVFLPLQEDVFPDTDDFGRVFRNNAVMSAMGIAQIAAIMGMCVAGGGYLPVMCDHVLMTDGSGLFLAGPALVQAAIGQKISAEELGGAAMHSAVSGTVDFREPNDEACIARIRSLVEKWGYRRLSPWDRKKPEDPALAPEERDPPSLVEHGVRIFGTVPREAWGRLRQLTVSGTTRDLWHLTRPELVLGRDVALKIPPSEAANDPLRRQRLELEARAVAALNPGTGRHRHPNIAASSTSSAALAGLRVHI